MTVPSSNISVSDESPTVPNKRQQKKTVFTDENSKWLKPAKTKASAQAKLGQREISSKFTTNTEKKQKLPQEESEEEESEEDEMVRHLFLKPSMHASSFDDSPRCVGVALYSVFQDVDDSDYEAGDSDDSELMMDDEFDVTDDEDDDDDDSEQEESDEEEDEEDEDESGDDSDDDEVELEF